MKPSVRPVTYDSYVMIGHHYFKPALGYIALKDLRPDHVQRFYNEKQDAGLLPRTIRYIHTVLHGALKQALKNQLVLFQMSPAPEDTCC